MSMPLRSEIVFKDKIDETFKIKIIVKRGANVFDRIGNYNCIATAN